MPIEKRYQPEKIEPALEARWQAEGAYHFDTGDDRPVYSIDSPPATVSGNLHMGHVYSYSHADFMARFFRMRGYNVFYPMGFDDNGLPTERYVEKKLKVSARQVGRQAFIETCLRASVEAEKEYRALWQRLGLSIDWRYSYRTIDEHSRRCSQYSFLDLYHKGLAYRAQAPMTWCSECHTAIAQADIEDRERSSEFVTLPFAVDGGGALDDSAIPIATTRPELLAACVAVFVHPGDQRYQDWIGRQVRVPLYGQVVPVLADPAADPEKGSGAVMCCTFGDQADVAWWYGHKLPLIEAIDENGKMLPVTGELAGLSVEEARQRIKGMLAGQGLILARQPTTGAIRVHERCDTPVEFLVTAQWFIRILENKQKFIELGQQLHWHPAHMLARYQAWVENLNWDWCISRQRYFGVPFPVWYCASCGEIMVAEVNELPVDPAAHTPTRPCACGSTEFRPETDVMDTWATSSVSPELVTGWLKDQSDPVDPPDLKEPPDPAVRFSRLFPMTLRPQASEIIRTWAFYSIVKSYYHFGVLPWSDALISGWGLAAAGMGKISKSKGGGPLAPMQMIERYSADAVRYWAASTAPGKDSIISEEKIQMGMKLVTKLWNVARFTEPFFGGGSVRDAVARQESQGGPGDAETEDMQLPSLGAVETAGRARTEDSPTALLDVAESAFSPADRWILANLSRLVERVTAAFESYEYAQAKNEIEGFFWHDFTDNYLEMAKLRLYDPAHPAHPGAKAALKTVLRTLLKLLAPLLPYVTDEIWRALFAEEERAASIHKSTWPEARPETATADGEDSAEELGNALIAAASAVRRYKSENALSLGSEISRLQIAASGAALAAGLRNAQADLTSVTRARCVEIAPVLDPNLIRLNVEGEMVEVGIVP